MKLLIFFALLISSFLVTEGLRCYACSKNEADPDMTCVDEPSKTKPITCDKKYCVTIRQEYKDTSHRVANMYRSCSDVKLDQTLEDDTYKTYYRSCLTDLCNDGSGKEDSELGNDDNKQGMRGTLYIKGTGAGLPSAFITPFLIVILVVSVTFL